MKSSPACTEEKFFGINETVYIITATGRISGRLSLKRKALQYMLVIAYNSSDIVTMEVMNQRKRKSGRSPGYHAG